MCRLPDLKAYEGVTVARSAGIALSSSELKRDRPETKEFVPTLSEYPGAGECQLSRHDLPEAVFQLPTPLQTVWLIG